MPALTTKLKLGYLPELRLRRGNGANPTAGNFRGSMALTLCTIALGEIFLAQRVHLSGIAQLLNALPGFMLLLGCFYYCERRPLPGVVVPCEMALWAVLSSNILAFMIQLAARSPFPLVDVQLAGLDQLMHFDTAAIARFTAHLPLIQVGFSLAYAAIPLLVFGAIFIPSFCGKVRSSQRYVMAVVIATVFTSVLFAVWPACGPWTTERLQPTVEQAAVTARLLLLKSPAPAVFELKHTALVSFPSFHVVLAILSAMALNELPRLRRYASAIALPTCLSTITTGWHYGVDVLGGLAVAAVAWRIASLILTVECRKGTTVDLVDPSRETGEDLARYPSALLP